MVAVQWPKISQLSRSQTVHFAPKPLSFSYWLHHNPSKLTLFSSFCIIVILNLLTTIVICDQCSHLDLVLLIKKLS